MLIIICVIWKMNGIECIRNEKIIVILGIIEILTKIGAFPAINQTAILMPICWPWLMNSINYCDIES